MKFSKKYVYYKAVANIFVSILIAYAMFTSFVTEDGDVLPFAPIAAIVAGVLYYTISLIYFILYRYFSYYEVNENEVICRSGILFRKKSILDYNKIHAVNIKQNIIEKIFKVSTLTIDSGSTNTAHKAEIKIIEDHKVTLQLMEYVKAKQRGEEVEKLVLNNDSKIEEYEVSQQKENLYSFTSKRKVLYSFFNSIGGMIIFLLCIVLIDIILALINYFSSEKINITLVTLFILLGFVVLTLFVFVVSMIGSFLQYHDFKMYKNGNDIDLNYGLLTRNSNTFKINKIKAIRINQGLIKRIFKFVTIKVEVIGYTQAVNNDDNRKTGACGILIPLCKESEIDYYLNKILPDYKPTPRQTKSKYYFPFVSYGLLSWLITYLVIEISLLIPCLCFELYEILFSCSLFVTGFFGLPIIIFLLEKVFEYKTQGISINDDVLTIYHGGIVREIVVVNKKNIIGVDKITTYYRNKKDVYSYVVHIKTNANTNTIRVNNLDCKETKQLYSLVNY